MLPLDINSIFILFGAIYSMSKMKLIMERWKRTEKELNENCGYAHQRDEPAHGSGDEWSFLDALNEPAMDRDDTPEFEISDDFKEASIGGQTTPSGRSVGGRTVDLDTFMDPEFAHMTPAPAEDLVSNFNDAFNLARRQGKAKFDHNGKKYASRLRDEADTDWAQNLGMSLWDLHNQTGKVDSRGLKDWLATQEGKTTEEMEQDYLEQNRPLRRESKNPTKKYTLRLKG